MSLGLGIANEAHDRSERVFAVVEILDKFDDAVVKLEIIASIRTALIFLPLIFEGDVQPGVQIGQLTKPLTEDVVSELNNGENLPVGLEGDLGARLFASTDLFEFL